MRTAYLKHLKLFILRATQAHMIEKQLKIITGLVNIHRE